MKWLWLTLFFILIGSVLALARWADGAANRDWETVERLVGYPGETEGDSFKISVPRSDLNVLVHGSPVDPQAGLTSWFAFKPRSHGSLLIGEMVLVDWETPRIEALLESYQFALTSIYRPFNGENPGLERVGFTGSGPRALLAQEVRSLLTATSMPASSPLVKTPPSTVQTAFGLPLEKILGPAHWEGGTLSFSFVPPIPITNEGAEIPPYMGFETIFHFQTDEKISKVYGQWVLSQKEAQSVAEILMKNHIGLTDTHSVLLDLSPQPVFIDFWVEGEPIKIAKVLKEALGQTRLVGLTPGHAPETKQP